MRILGFSRLALLSCVAAAILAGCGGSQPPIGAPGAVAQIRSTTSNSGYSVLHSFGGPGDGSEPWARLLNVNGVLYGTTSSGGRTLVSGTIYTILPSGQERVLYSGTSNSDEMLGGLTQVGELLYGSAWMGGTRDAGNVYSFPILPASATPSGIERVIYQFPGNLSGALPNSDLTYSNGKLFGGTESGGCCTGEWNAGTVFSVTLAGHRHVLHLFGGAGDANSPAGDLLVLQGNVYGTARGGGGPSDCGNVYTATQAGVYTVLYSFAGGTDACNSNSGLIQVNGTLYGTSEYGGTHGQGTVFSITPAGNEKVIYSFAGPPNDGAYSSAGLLYAAGKLYGTTTYGGTCATTSSGCGTVFSVTLSGTETVLYKFGGEKSTGHSDGKHPLSSLINVGGRLYGTTLYGGSFNDCDSEGQGCGTVYSIGPSK
ncbi:MAG TPA: choice-of-anchor tandem repeat GloVer-containing protein [Candidatus Cybelea sp.]|jgi:uncharacterized repeat protein (TIGR03803 family)|nr:choice-of-anchor tandem repeat GloVer-containing protein [Candidatus Cybelea sp.]